MRLLVDILHPAHVHLFRAFIDEMQARGHEVLVTAREKDIAVELLQAFGIPHRTLSVQRKGAVSMVTELARRAWAVWRLSRSFKPDFMIGCMGPAIAIAGRFMKAKTIVYYDNETARIVNAVVSRLCDAYMTPVSFVGDMGRAHRRYEGFHGLAYLHPNRFTPDPAVLAKLDLSPDKPFFVVRFVAWESVHDVGETGFSDSGKRRLIERLAREGQMILSVEGAVPAEFQHYCAKVPVEKMHHLLAYCRLFVGESATMAEEACLLGSHAIFVSRSGRGVIDEIEQRYGLAHYFTASDEDRALARLDELLALDDVKADAKARQEKLLSEKIDLTAAMVETVEAMHGGGA